jgi:hypothetical protein
MPALTKTWDIREIIEAGLNALGETMNMLKMTPLCDRMDAVYLKGLTACTRAAVEIAKDQRDAAAFFSKMELHEEDLVRLLSEHLAKMPAAQLEHLVSEAMGKRTPPKKRA